MPSRLPRRTRPPVRLISFRTAPATVDSALAPAPERPDRFGQRPAAPPGPPLRAVPAPVGSGDGDLAVAAVAIAQACAEVIAGLRPLHHLAGRATPEVYEQLARTIPMVGRARHPTGRALRLRVPLIQQPAPGVAEVCAVVFTGMRAQALALRLALHRGRWRCAAVETTLSPRFLSAHQTARRGTAA